MDQYENSLGAKIKQGIDTRELPTSLEEIAADNAKKEAIKANEQKVKKQESGEDKLSKLKDKILKAQKKKRGTETIYKGEELEKIDKNF